jgi:hypothetical protein
MDEIECQELFLIVIDIIAEFRAGGDVLHLLDVLGMRHGRVNLHLETDELGAVQAEVHAPTSTAGT